MMTGSGEPLRSSARRAPVGATTTAERRRGPSPYAAALMDDPDGTELGRHATKVAIELMTLWVDPVMHEEAIKNIGLILQPGGEDPPGRVIAGLLDLNRFILYELATARGATSHAQIVEQAREILQGLSSGLE
jgi:hypothetical protein